MNLELKAILSEVFDGMALGKDVMAKNYIALTMDVVKMIEDAPLAIGNISDLQAEIQALQGSAQQADLIAFIQSKFAEQIPSQKAQAILSIALKIVQDAVGLVEDSIQLKNVLSSS